jgi:hypothetical protein
VQTVSDAVAWADAVIAEDSAPDPTIIDLALSGNRRPHAVISLLSAVPGTFDHVDVCRRLLGTMLVQLDHKPSSAEAIARALYQFAAVGEWPDEALGSQPYALDDSFALVREGYGTWEDAVEDLRNYLRQYSSLHQPT